MGAFGGGWHIDKMPTPAIVGWLCLTLFVLVTLTWTAFAEPAPIYIRVIIPFTDSIFLLGWVIAIEALWRRFIRWRRRA